MVDRDGNSRPIHPFAVEIDWSRFPAASTIPWSRWNAASRSTLLRAIPGELFRREVRLRVRRQTWQPTLPLCSFCNTTHDVWRTCELCGTKSRRMKKCSGCRLAHYCDAACQKSHWSLHKGCCCPDVALPLGRRYIPYMTYNMISTDMNSVD